MGVTGANGFPCCGKESVDILETQGDVNQHQFQPIQDEDEMELEKELLELEPGHKADLDLDPELEPEMEQEPEALLQSALCPVPMLKPEAELDMEPNLEFRNEDPRQQGYRIGALHPYPEGLMQQDISEWSVRSNSSYLSFPEDDQVCTDHRSIHVQTSKHLFWADKLIQASENSLQRAIGMQPSKRSTDETTSHPNQKSVPKDTLCSGKQLQNPSAQPALLATGSQQPPSPCLSSSSLPPALGLAELINFASSLAMASSSKIDLPNLEHVIKAPPQKAMEPPTEAAGDCAAQPAAEEPELKELTEELSEKPLEAGKPQKAWKQEDKNFPHPYLDFSKPGVKRATIEGEVNLLQPPAMPPASQGAVKEQQRAEDQETPVGTEKVQASTEASKTAHTRPRRGAGRQDAEGEAAAAHCPADRVEPAVAMATGAEQASWRAREFEGLVATHSVQSGPGTESPSFAAENLLPLTPRQLAAFQDIFKLFSSSPTGTVDMRSMKAALRHVGVPLSPQEMCEALRQADLDGDGTVSFKDFLGVLTDSHRLAQCLGQVRNSRFCDPQGLQTLFLEMLFKLMSQGFVPSNSVQEVMSFYSKMQRALRLNPGWKGGSRGHGRTARAHADLTFFCQAARLGGLSSAELARSLHRLHKAGSHSPYSQIPNLARWTRPERKTRNRAPRPDVRLPNSYQPSHPKLRPNRGPLSQGFVGQPLESMRPSKLAPSPPTLVQKQPFSPSPASLQRPAMKNLYK